MVYSDNLMGNLPSLLSSPLAWKIYHKRGDLVRSGFVFTWELYVCQTKLISFK